MPRLEKKIYKVSSIISVSDVPHLSLEKEAHKAKSDIDNFEGLFIDYGWRETSYPYTQQNSYAEEAEQEITVAVLENDYLYAEFLPTLGGRLWKLYDKKKQRDMLDKKLPDFLNDISLQKGEVKLCGSGFGYLNEKLGGKSPAHLEFFADDDVKPWLDLADNSPLSGRLPFAYGSKMENLLLKNKDVCNWNIVYQLALLAYDRRDFEKAKQFCEQSLILDNNEYNNYFYAFVLYQFSDERSVYFAEKCIDINGGSYCLAESVLALLLKQKAYSSVIRCFDKLSDDIKKNPRILMYLSMAYLKSGDAQKAEKILTGNGGLVLLDFREGDKFLDILYRSIRKELYGENYSEVIVPEQFDFIVSDIKTEKTE